MKAEDEALAAFGLYLEGPRPDTACDVYADNWSAVQVFLSSATQWRHGMHGAYGLDYPAVRMVARTIGVKWDAQLLLDITIMESAMLNMKA